MVAIGNSLKAGSEKHRVQFFGRGTCQNDLLDPANILDAQIVRQIRVDTAKVMR